MMKWQLAQKQEPRNWDTNPKTGLAANQSSEASTARNF